MVKIMASLVTDSVDAISARKVAKDPQNFVRTRKCPAKFEETRLFHQKISN